MIKSMCFEITIDYELLQINFNEIIYSHTFTVIFSANLVYKVFEIRVAILKTWQLKSSSFNQKIQQISFSKVLTLLKTPLWEECQVTRKSLLIIRSDRSEVSWLVNCVWKSFMHITFSNQKESFIKKISVGCSSKQKGPF